MNGNPQNLTRGIFQVHKCLRQRSQIRHFIKCLEIFKGQFAKFCESITENSRVFNFLRERTHQIYELFLLLPFQMILKYLKGKNCRNSVFCDLLKISRWMFSQKLKIVLNTILGCTFLQTILSHERNEIFCPKLGK